MLECIARILRLRKSDKTARFPVISIQRRRRKINGAYFSVFGIRAVRARSGLLLQQAQTTRARSYTHGCFRVLIRQPDGAEREVVALFESFGSAYGMIRSIDGRMSRARISVTMFRQKDDRALLFKRRLCVVLHFSFDNTCKLYIFTFLYKSAYFVRKLVKLFWFSR